MISLGAQTVSGSTYDAIVNWFTGVDNQTPCYGGGARLNQTACAAANQQGASDYAASNPAAAVDYNNLVSGDVFGLLNPFTGTGPLANKDGTNPLTQIPAWMWIVGGAVVFFGVMEHRR